MQCTKSREVNRARTPSYHQRLAKRQARAENLHAYRMLTGRHRLPADQEYWTLCNLQPTSDGSEWSQLVDCGFLNPEQFIGVDRDASAIQQNVDWHPESSWHCGEWLDVIRQQELFNPGLIYLDTLHWADSRQLAGLVAATMPLCPADTVLLVNAVLFDNRSGYRFERDALPTQIQSRVGWNELSKWRSDIPNFEYRATAHTDMVTYAFRKTGG